jgi:hypothetical protein
MGYVEEVDLHWEKTGEKEEVFVIRRAMANSTVLILLQVKTFQ